MADKKISQLTTLIQANVDVTADFVPIVDTGAVETKKVTPQALVQAGATGATLAIADGAAGTPSLTNAGDENTGLWFPAADTIAASTAGSERLRLDSSGNFGIGTASPGYKLHVERPSYGVTGYFFTNDGTRNPRLVIYGSADGTTLQHTYSTGAGSLIFANGGAIGAGNEVGRFDANGNLGIGVTPRAWAGGYKSLDITGPGAIASAASGDTFTQVANGAWFNGTNWIYQYTSIGAARYQMTGPSGGGNHSWYVAGSGTAGNTVSFTQAMTLDASGNLGIGTANPTYKIEVLLAAGSGNIARFGQTGVSNGYTITTNGSALTHEWATAGSVSMKIDANANIVAGASVALATSATDGFLYVPTCAGTPTGTPTAITGMAPIVVNTTNNKLYFYSGGVWRDAGP